MKDYLWTTYSARKLLAKLKPQLESVNWTCALGGSVASHGHSDNDMDLVVFPYNASKHVNKCDLLSILEKEMVLQMAAEDVYSNWRRKYGDDADVKHVEIWRYKGRRVDVIVLNG